MEACQPERCLLKGPLINLLERKPAKALSTRLWRPLMLGSEAVRLQRRSRASFPSKDRWLHWISATR